MSSDERDHFAGATAQLQAQTASTFHFKNSRKCLKNKTFLRFSGVALMIIPLSVC
jgi:hypothetical protein